MTIIVFAFMTFFGQPITAGQDVKFLALGDSYTIGESVAEDERWPVQLARMLWSKGIRCADPMIIATTGWRTDQLKQAVVNAKLKPDFDLVSLLIGVNNQYQGKTPESYAPEFEALLTMAIHYAKGNKENVFVVSIPDYGYTPFGKEKQESITRGVDAFNAVNKKITEQYGVTYINITDISRRGMDEPDLVAADGLHPSGKMYGEWAVRIFDRVEEKMIRR